METTAVSLQSGIQFIASKIDPGCQIYDTSGTLYNPQHADLENDESDKDYSFGTKEEYILTSQAIEAVNVLLNLCVQENFDFIDVINLRNIRTQRHLFQTEKNKTDH